VHFVAAATFAAVNPHHPSGGRMKTFRLFALLTLAALAALAACADPITATEMDSSSAEAVLETGQGQLGGGTR
jgi:hypothetical protein